MKLASSRAEALVWVSLVGILSLAFWYSLTSTLDQLTLRDCNAGITKACNQLKK